MILSLDKRPQLLSGAESAGKNIFSVLTKKKKRLSTDWSSTSHVHRRRTPDFWLFFFVSSLLYRLQLLVKHDHESSEKNGDT